MGCSCRATPVRFFIQGLTQVHQLEASTLRLRAPAASQAILRSCFAAGRQTRYLHATRQLRNEDASANAKVAEPAKAEKAEKAAPVTAGESTAAEKPEKPDDNASTTLETAPVAKVADVDEPIGKSRGKKDLSLEERHTRWRLSGDKLPSPRAPRKPSPPIATPHTAPPPPERTTPLWKAQKEALAQKFPEGWKPRKRLSPDALAGIRALNAQFPDIYTTERLASKFEVAPEAIRRILRSKWRPSVEEEMERQERWLRRGESVYRRKAAMGFKAPRKWREVGVVREPSYHEWRQGAVQRNKEFEGGREGGRGDDERGTTNKKV